MKSAKYAALIAVFILVLAPALFSQTVYVPMATSITGSVTIDVPFRFEVGGKSFPSGEYTFTPVNGKGIKVQSVETPKNAVIVLTNAVSTNGTEERPHLVFHRYGDASFLAQVWTRHGENGREIVVSPEEIKLARSLHQEAVVLMASK